MKSQSCFRMLAMAFALTWAAIYNRTGSQGCLRA